MLKVSGQLWLGGAERPFLGHGRIELLERIRDTGSISKAARAMGMSYKAAWDSVDAMNNLAERPLVQRSAGGRHGGGTRLTAHGCRLIEVYRAAEREYQQFLHRVSRGIEDFDRFYDLVRSLSMKTSARNEFQGKVRELKTGGVNTEVIVGLPGGNKLVAIVTNESAKSLELAVGKEVIVLIKASWVILTGAEEKVRTSARNRLCGTVVRLVEGAVDCEVVIELSGGKRIAAVVTNASVRNLGLKVGVRACALVKASHVILAVNE